MTASTSPAPVPPSPYAWGAPNPDGLAVALVPASRKVKAGEPLQYRVAFANRSTKPLKVVLFPALEGKFRTRVALVAKSGAEQASGAIGPAQPVSSPLTIAVTLKPGEELLRDGMTVTARPVGDLTGYIEWGGPPVTPNVLRSAGVAITVEP